MHEVIDPRTTGKPVQLLPVPYVSQLGEGANAFHNDCGAACGAMLIKAYTGNNITPDDFYRATGQADDDYLSVTQLMTVLTAHGISTEWYRELSLVDLFAMLVGGRPAIVLFNYGALREKVSGLENTTFSGAHFAVMTGIDTINVYLHDPLWTITSGYSGGEAIPIAHADWMYIWEAAQRDYNPECAALVPVVGVGAFTGVTELYQVRVTSADGIRIRTAPRVARGTDTGRGVPNGYVAKIWAEERDAEGNLWGAITVDKRKWIALEFRGVQLVERA
ncbi:MAG: hypothetical protein GYB65_05500 [Chloroflexi bacterium]|nr:hypothetical protein [Chloroflexota bacterium]